MVEPPDDEPPGLPVLFFTEVPEAKGGKNRVHVDVVADETVDDEVIRLEGSGPPCGTGPRTRATSGR